MILDLQFHYGSHAETQWRIKKDDIRGHPSIIADKGYCIQTCRGTHPVYRYIISADKLPFTLIGIRFTSRGNRHKRVIDITVPGYYGFDYLLGDEDFRQND